MAAATKKKPAARKAPAKKTSTKKVEHKTVVDDNPFAPGTKVGVYRPEEAEFVRSDEREPPSSPLTTATVDKEGILSVGGGLKPGSYIAVGKVAESGGRFGARFGQLNFVVRK